ncbi:hypothetical protein BpHYR1_033852 [Brachionus plicatilis]|uniref:Uncharacterized protein n=1 Tax=Brachionus plicatilis TaxID=10195 RepID=A0A3M7T068_BRAPC|nr:hypothetical protein BpHYR1_033852 [Brachionus plicatilis]
MFSDQKLCAEYEYNNGFVQTLTAWAWHPKNTFLAAPFQRHADFMIEFEFCAKNKSEKLFESLYCCIAKALG